MKRRHLLSLVAAAPLAGCGFQLRGATVFSFESVWIGGATNSPIARELRQVLAEDSHVRVVGEAEDRNRAQVLLELPVEQREKVVVGLNAAGQVREFQLRLRVHFTVRTPRGEVLVPETELLQTRDISFSEQLALAKEAEEAMLYRDMQSDLVQQLMRRLAAVRIV